MKAEIEMCPSCQGTKRVLHHNVSEGMLGTFTDGEIKLLCTIPCPRCTKSTGDSGLFPDHSAREEEE